MVQRNTIFLWYLIMFTKISKFGFIPNSSKQEPESKKMVFYSYWCLVQSKNLMILTDLVKLKKYILK